jgi:hypothetical protein
VRRSRLLALIALGFVVFAVVSALLARIWSSDSAEQSAVTALLSDEARGDSQALISAIKGCAASPACRARAATDASALRRPGHVSIIEYTPSTGFSLSSTLGTARVVWEVVDETKPITQCVLVRRAGNALSGITIELLKVSLRLKRSDADCPAHY